MNGKLYLSTVLTALLTAIATSPCQAQHYMKIYNGSISVEPNELKQEGDSLHLKMNLEIPMNQLDIKSRQSITLIPVLEGSKGSMSFPSILINGRNRDKVYKRQMALNKKQSSPVPYEVVRKGSSSTIYYSQSVPFEAWMEDSHLSIVEDLCGCAGANLNSVRSQIFNAVELERIEIYISKPQLAYISPAVETIKKRAEVKDVFLDFKTGSAVILKSLNQNEAELQKVENMIRDVKNDDNLTINGLVFNGYASPEGSVASNLRLSDQRAKSMMNYLISQVNLQGISTKAIGNGEDWGGLEKLLSGSSVQGKEKLLDIIHTCGNSDVCEQKMRSINGGAPYRQMLAEIYPQLRRTVCSVDYTVRDFTVEEGREIIKKHPQQLSLNEMYMVANSYPAGSEEFNEIFETAVRMFPDDDVANLNAANSAIERRDLISARKYLERVNSASGEAENCQGVICLLEDDYDNAEKHFRKAQAAGVESATFNLEELDKKRSNALLIESKKRK